MEEVSLVKSGLTLSVAKIFRILISFYTFGIVPRYLDNFEYGLIAVIGASTVLLSSLDLGFGQGLRNKLNSEHNKIKQAEYFFSVFLSLLIALTCLSIILFTICNITQASKYFFAIPGNRVDLILASNICLGLLLLNIPFSMASLIMMSFHEYKTIFLYEITNVVYNVILVTLLLIFKNKFPGDLFLIFSILGTILINITYTLVFLKNRNWFNKKYIQPIKFWINDLREVFAIGKHFLLGSITYTVFFYADSIIVAQLFNLERAGDFRILLVIFQSVIAVLQSYFSPLWDISGKLYISKNFKEIRKNLNRNMLLTIVLFLLAIIFAPLFLLPILKLWTGRNIQINNFGILILQVWFVFNLFPYSYNMVLNGIGKIKPIIFVQLAGAIIKIPFCIWLGNKYGLTGIIVANTFILLGAVIIYPVYTYKYLSKAELNMY